MTSVSQLDVVILSGNENESVSQSVNIVRFSWLVSQFESCQNLVFSDPLNTKKIVNVISASAN